MPEGTETVSPDKVPDFPLIWNVPYQRNPFFTGREDVLKRLHMALTSGKTAALTQPKAISGLGGIGKTQTAVEYAYRYRNEYQAVLWATADSREVLVSDFAGMADLLDLPEKIEQDQSVIVNAVKRWLKNRTDWLLIFDNVDDITIVRDFMPLTGGGHILLTTRAKALGRLAQCIEMENMKPEEGALFLLRCANIIAPNAPLDNASIADRIKAREISQAVDGLPLALDQAGAYIEETACGLTSYLNLYQTRSTVLLKQRGKLALDHPEPVAATWSHSFEKIQHANPAAAELLWLCSFLYPDLIPEEIITEGASDLGPILQPLAEDPIELNAAIGELLKFSLVNRDPEAKTLTIHRLVQAMLKAEMNKDTQRLWAERVVRAVNSALPDIEFGTWQQWQRCFPHVQVCKSLIEQWKMTFVEAAQLFYQAAYYLHSHAQHHQAEPLFKGALAIYEQVVGLDHPNVIACFDKLASLYHEQGLYDQAEPFFQQALRIRERILGPDHPSIGKNLNDLGLLYQAQGKYTEAELYFQDALTIGEKVLGSEHPFIAATLNNLALLYYAQGEYSQAETLFLRALAIYEQMEALNHPDVATYLNNLAQMYYTMGKYTQAEPLLQRALMIYEQALGSDHPNLATFLENYAELSRKMRRKAKTAKLQARAKAIRAKHAQEDPSHE